MTIIPLISLHYYQYNSSETLARLEASHKIKQLRFSSITKHHSRSRNIISKIISQILVDRSKFDAILIFTETTSEKVADECQQGVKNLFPHFMKNLFHPIKEIKILSQNHKLFIQSSIAWKDI